MVKPTRPWPTPPSPYATPMRETRMWYRYDKKFSLFPIKCEGGYWVWFNHYYEKYLVFSYKEINDIVFFLLRMFEFFKISK